MISRWRGGWCIPLLGVCLMIAGVVQGQSLSHEQLFPSRFGDKNIPLAQPFGAPGVNLEKLLSNQEWLYLHRWPPGSPQRRAPGTDPIGRLDVETVDNRQVWCSASLISEDLILTNDHRPLGIGVPNRPLLNYRRTFPPV